MPWISVTLFFLAINNIHEQILPPVKCTFFADDLTIFMKGVYIRTMQKIMQKPLDKLVSYANTEGLKFQLVNRKTSYSVVKRKRIKVLY